MKGFSDTKLRVMEWRHLCPRTLTRWWRRPLGVAFSIVLGAHWPVPSSVHTGCHEAPDRIPPNPAVASSKDQDSSGSNRRRVRSDLSDCIWGKSSLCPSTAAGVLLSRKRQRAGVSVLVGRGDGSWPACGCQRERCSSAVAM